MAFVKAFGFYPVKLQPTLLSALSLVRQYFTGLTTVAVPMRPATRRSIREKAWLFSNCSKIRMSLFALYLVDKTISALLSDSSPDAADQLFLAFEEFRVFFHVEVKKRVSLPSPASCSRKK